MLLPAVIAIVVVAIVVIAILALRVHPATTSASVSGTPLFFGQILGPASAAQATRTGGPWVPYGIVGIGVDQSYTGAGGLISGCTIPWENTSNVVVPSTSSTASAGAVSAWFVASVNASKYVLLSDVTDLGGTIAASNLAVLQGSCTSTFTPSGAIPSGVANSSGVAVAANGLGGSAFLSENPGATTLISILGPFYVLEYTTCNPFSPTTGSGSEFVAVFNATSGTLIENEGVSSVTSCS